MRISHSCLSCAKRKRGCDLTKPACKRCVKLGIECDWPSRSRKQGQLGANFRLASVTAAFEWAGAYSDTRLQGLSLDAPPVVQRRQTVEDIILAEPLQSSVTYSADQLAIHDPASSLDAEQHQASQMLYSIEPAAIRYLRPFMDYFCRKDAASSILVGGERVWKGATDLLIGAPDGSGNAVLAAASAFAFTRYRDRNAELDFVHYYSAGVCAVQAKISAERDIVKPTTVIGVLLLLTCECIVGQLAAYKAHLAALTFMIIKCGPRGCRREPLLANLLFAILPVVMQDCMLRKVDSPFASREWREYFLSASDPIATAVGKFIVVFADCCRCVAIQVQLAAKLDPSDERRTSNVVRALQLHQQLSQMEFTLFASASRAPVPADVIEALCASPIQPVMAFHTGWRLNLTSRVICYRLRLEQTFGIPSMTLLDDGVRLLQIAQYVAVTCHDSGSLLMQVVPLRLLQEFLGSSLPPAWADWIYWIQESIRAAGFGL